MLKVPAVHCPSTAQELLKLDRALESLKAMEVEGVELLPGCTIIDELQPPGRGRVDSGSDSDFH